MPNRIHNYLFIFFIVIQFVIAESIAEKVAHDLLKVTDSGEAGVQVMQKMIHLQQQGVLTVPGEFWKNFLKEVNSEELLNLIDPVYKNYLSVEEMNTIIQFYQLPAGKKWIESMPVSIPE